MKIIDALGQPCPIPVIEAKKTLAEQGVEGVSVKVDNIVSVQNLEKMANGYGYGFSYIENANSFDVMIIKGGKIPPGREGEDIKSEDMQASSFSNGLTVVISRNTMGGGSEELGKILIKGFIYSLTKLPAPPKFVIFLNSGAYITSDGYNTVDDLKDLERKGTEVLTCGTCANYYELQDKLAVGTITDMYDITEKMANASNIINI